MELRLEELSLSYNGGKDCLLLLILYLTALHTHHHKTHPPQPLPATLQSVYIITPNSFPAVDAFVTHTEKLYHLHLSRYAKPMKEAFTDYLSSSSTPQNQNQNQNQKNNTNNTIKAIFVGTRRTDPHGAKLKHFDPTDRGWPAFMRIHPVIDWHYAEVWTFLREVGVEYCELYDEGYTSLGGTEDTHPNPALAVVAEPGEMRRFRPAYELVEDGEERLGRDW
ncbi:hypothetical protein LTR62_000598 [Meristemomyces frigidus]|uniref:FAD synthase n=1 Tax=Meristemomyces frigidus TaxID=1508187 RepID=A0AAN7TCX8_9PEZI|nr:hypothetical protein LTR62_000598 [Meristemomyces frigidus]